MAWHAGPIFMLRQQRLHRRRHRHLALRQFGAVSAENEYPMVETWDLRETLVRHLRRTAAA